ncbi:MAG: cation:proton antiporter [Candidatus Aenigmatarchaeota archaeon]
MIDGVLSTVLLDLIIVLIAAKIGGWLSEKIGQPEVFGEILVGLILGPSILGIINPFATEENAKIIFEIISFLGEIGIMLLLFQVGLESNIYKLIKCGKTSLLVALIGVITPFFLGFSFLFFVLKYSFIISVFVGSTLVATSVGITMRVLKDMKKINSEEGRIILGAAVIDDVIGLIFLSSAIGLLTATNISVNEILVNAFIKMITAILFLTASIWIGIKFSPYIFKIVQKLKIKRTFIVSAFIFMLVYGYLANSVGLAAIVGAFAAGLIFERLEEKEHFKERVKPVANIFVPVFFVLAGSYVSIKSFANPFNLILIIIIFIIAITGKMVSGIGAIKTKAKKMSIGLGMIPRGEVGLICASYGLSAGLFTNDLYSILVAVIMLTTLIAPPCISYSLKRRNK